MKTRAVRDGNDYVINGNKILVGGKHTQVSHMVFAVTNPELPRFKNLSAVLVPGSTPGITIEKLDLIAGGGKNMVFLDNVRVPASTRIGKEGQGWRAFAGPRVETGSAVLHDPEHWV